MKHLRVGLDVLLMLLASFFLPATQMRAADRQVIRIDTGWKFQREGAAAGQWKPVTVPSSMQEHEGNDFHGVGIYRVRTPNVLIGPKQRLLLQFGAVATHATVRWDGQKVAEHLGGWTPFRVDVTELARGGGEAAEHEIEVRVDERVGHNTQGFLPIIQPHFGGIWQEVKLVVVPETYIEEMGLLAWGNPATDRIEVRLPVRGTGKARRIVVRYRLRGTESWTESELPTQTSDDAARLADVEVKDVQLWSPDHPNLYDVEVRLREDEGGDHVATRAAFRRIEAKGDHISLNCQPVVIRGVLNWGYYPPRLAPHEDEQRFRRDIELARSWGFNLMKFCLWIPPRRFLELADEMGMLVWLEYPTWHPQLDKDHLPDLQREFGEFFRYDRGHPSAVLRSLTCETGPGADIQVIQSLYEMAHREIPGALVEDDSSWIGWNRVHDFYDDHSYGNNHTWVSTLSGFKEYILAHGPKPLVLGEAIAADTWPDRGWLARKVHPERPYWVPGFFEALEPWQQRMQQIAGPGGLERLGPDSLHYAMLMRKFQIEAYRREVPYGGYVVSVIRDFPTASMGLLDYADQPKWPASEWSWHGETMLLLRTDHDRRAFTAGETLHADLLLSHMADRTLENGELTVALVQPGERPKELQRATKDKIEQNSGTLASLLTLDWALPATDQPQHLEMVARLKSATKTYENRWPIWVVPHARPNPAINPWLHTSLSAEFFPGVARTDHGQDQKIAVASAFDDELVEFLERGGRVLMLPDGRQKSPPVADHWFLRGAPYVPDHPLQKVIPRDFWIELQHFDLAGPVVPDMQDLESIDPILMLWDDHDLKTVRTHGLLFETRAAKGRLLVSSLRLGATSGANPAGQWAMSVLLDHLAGGPEPKHALSDAAWKHLREKLHEEKIDLTQRKWRFKPDRNDEGIKQDWASPMLRPDETWKEINVGQPWDGQGYAGLTGYGWYRLTYRVPDSWKGRDVYLTFEGVDDSYDLFIDGHLAGKGGDKKKNETAFDQRITHRLTELAKPGREVVIAVRVDNWQGAGGIFRPVRLSTCAPATGLELIQ
jgi:Glycosyl hydrolases family 2, sugar binding domain/Glycosyl hydrolases family 2